MSTALNEISVAVFDNAVEIWKRMFDFHLGLPHMYISLFLTTVKFCILVQVLECVCDGYVAPLGWAGGGRGRREERKEREGGGRERENWKDGSVR